jgi:hypothetical protein
MKIIPTVINHNWNDLRKLSKLTNFFQKFLCGGEEVLKIRIEKTQKKKNKRPNIIQNFNSSQFFI